MVEAERRQQIFKTAGVTHIDDYQKRYYEGKAGRRCRAITVPCRDCQMNLLR